MMKKIASKALLCMHSAVRTYPGRWAKNFPIERKQGAKERRRRRELLMVFPIFEHFRLTFTNSHLNRVKETDEEQEEGANAPPEINLLGVRFMIFYGLLKANDTQILYFTRIRNQ
jgi:hypothetical protein